MSSVGLLHSMDKISFEDFLEMYPSVEKSFLCFFATMQTFFMTLSSVGPDLCCIDAINEVKRTNHCLVPLKLI